MGRRGSDPLHGLLVLNVAARQEAIRERSPHARREAADAAMALLSDGDDGDRVLAALLLADLGDTRALPALEMTPASSHGHSPLGNVSEAFAEAAARLREGLSKRALREDIDRLVAGMGAADGSVAGRCRAALAGLGLEGRRALLEALSEGAPQVRLGAALALGRGEPDPRVRGALLRALADDHAPVREWAAYGLRRHGNVSCVEPLLALLRDPAPRVRLQAILSLADLGDARAIPALERLAAEDEGTFESGRGPERLADTARSVLRTLRAATSPGGLR